MKNPCWLLYITIALNSLFNEWGVHKNVRKQLFIPEPLNKQHGRAVFLRPVSGVVVSPVWETCIELFSFVIRATSHPGWPRKGLIGNV